MANPVVVATGSAALAMYAGYQYTQNLRDEANAIAKDQGFDSESQDLQQSLKADAFRHAYTSAEITRLLGGGRYGEDVARMGGDAVEIASPGNREPGAEAIRDRNMDLLNNRTGRENGRTSTSKEDSIRKTMESLERGDLVTDPNNDRTDPAIFPRDLIPPTFPDSPLLPYIPSFFFP